MCFIVYVWTCTGSQFKYFGSFKIILFTGKTSWHLHTTLFPAPFCTACTYSFFTTMNLQKMMYGGKQHFQCSLFFFPLFFLTHFRIKLCTVQHYICALQEMESIQVWFPATHQTPSRSGSLATTIKICYL